MEHWAQELLLEGFSINFLVLLYKLELKIFLGKICKSLDDISPD